MRSLLIFFSSFFILTIAGEFLVDSLPWHNGVMYLSGLTVGMICGATIK